MLQSCNLVVHHWSASGNMLVLVQVSTELCWIGICLVMITQKLFLTLLNLIVWYGSILIIGPKMRILCSFSVLCKVHLFLEVELKKCILFHCQPWWSLVRWFKFTHKPPYSIGCGKLLLAIWDTSFWTIWSNLDTRDHNTYILVPILVIFSMCHFLMILGPFEYLSKWVVSEN